MVRHVSGHRVDLDPCDGIPRHWRVRVDGTFVGLIAMSQPDRWRTAPVRTPGRPCGPVCHCPTLTAALVTLLVETIEH